MGSIYDQVGFGEIPLLQGPIYEHLTWEMPSLTAIILGMKAANDTTGCSHDMAETIEIFTLQCSINMVYVF
jgi:hypothetical protein